jgi:hypothetical protein
MFDIFDTMISGRSRTRFKNLKPELLAVVHIPSGKNFMDYELMAPIAMRYQFLGINCDRLKGQVTEAKDKLTKASLKDPKAVLDLVLSTKTSLFLIWRCSDSLY